MFENQIQYNNQNQVGFSISNDIVESIKAQIEIDCFEEEYKPQANEICLIIIEMFMLPPNAPVQIAGQKMPAAFVCSIYNMLSHNDIIAVMDNFEKATYEIKHKKTYLRTALYNSVFERESREINELRVMDAENEYLGTRRECIESRQLKATKEYLAEQEKRGQI